PPNRSAVTNADESAQYEQQDVDDERHQRGGLQPIVHLVHLRQVVRELQPGGGQVGDRLFAGRRRTEARLVGEQPYPVPVARATGGQQLPEHVGVGLVGVVEPARGSRGLRLTRPLQRLQLGLGRAERRDQRGTPDVATRAQVVGERFTLHIE